MVNLIAVELSRPIHRPIIKARQSTRRASHQYAVETTPSVPRPCPVSLSWVSLAWQAVYVAPLKALARERLKDWREKFEKKMGMGVLELTGDNTPDVDALK